MKVGVSLAIKARWWILTLSYLMGGAGLAGAQKTKLKFELLFQIRTDAVNFTTDKVQQIYLISPTNEVIKYTSEGKEQFRYNNNLLGKLHILDTTNPFSLLLFYSDFQTLVTLDRTLSETGQLNFFDVNSNFIKTVATSNDNQIWIYDDVSFQLKKINAQGGLITESAAFNQLFTEPPYISQMIARNNELYLGDKEQGIFIFDRFGQFVKRLDIKGIRFFQVIDDQLVALIDQDLVIFDLLTFQSGSFPLSTELSPDAVVNFQKNALYILQYGSLEVYRF